MLAADFQGLLDLESGEVANLNRGIEVVQIGRGVRVVSEDPQEKYPAAAQALASLALG